MKFRYGVNSSSGGVSSSSMVRSIVTGPVSDAGRPFDAKSPDGLAEVGVCAGTRLDARRTPESVSVTLLSLEPREVEEQSQTFQSPVISQSLVQSCPFFILLRLSFNCKLPVSGTTTVANQPSDMVYPQAAVGGVYKSRYSLFLQQPVCIE